MRFYLAIALCAVVFAPGAALAGPMECQAMTRSIGHFEGQLAKAQELDNEMWAEKTAEHLEILRNKRAATCPQWSPNAQAQRAAIELMRLAAKAAAKYFTMGAF